MAAWHYVMNQNFHYCSAGSNTGTVMTYNYDPVQLLNAYGYGCCDQVTRTLIWIWEAAGYQGRMVELPFHVVPEIFYAGSWHMLDPDHRVFYLQDDGSTIASVADIFAEPSLVARTADANGNDPIGFSAVWMAQQYAQSAPSVQYYTKPGDIFRPLGIPVTLHAHEEMTIHSENSMPSPQFYNYGDPFLPQNVSYAEFNWDLSLGDNLWRSRAYRTTNVDIFPDALGTKYVKHVSGDPGYLVYQESTVFPVLALSITAEVGPASPLLYAYFSTDGSHWSAPVKFQPANAISSYQLTADLSALAKGSYKYYINIQINRGQLHKLRISPVVQTSKHLFPTLAAGASNQLFYTDSSTYAGRVVRVSAQVPAGNPPIRSPWCPRAPLTAWLATTVPPI
jgi:hypothetical protein